MPHRQSLAPHIANRTDIESPPNAHPPQVFLKCRPFWSHPSCATPRQEIIDHAKAEFTALCDELKAAGAPETLNVCTIAYFYDVLFGDGNGTTTTHTGVDGQIRSEIGDPVQRSPSVCRAPAVTDGRHR